MAAIDASRVTSRIRRHNHLRARVTVTGCLLLMLVADAQAVNWTLTPRVSGSVTYSDNITLAPDGSERYDVVTSISPGFSLVGEGRRFNLNVFYNLQYLNYARDTSSDRLLNQLRAAGNAELVEEWFFVDVNASIRQENISPRGRVASSNISVTNNQTTVYTLRLSPYLRHQFGTFGTGGIRYDTGFLDRDNISSQTKSDRIFADFVSGSRFQVMPWNVFYSRINNRPQNRTDSLFERAEAGGRYRFDRKYALIFGAGYEHNVFETRPDTDRTSGPTWRLGFGWTPSPRTNVDVGVSDRFFGLAPFLSATHRSRRTVLSFNYSEEPTTTSQITLNQDFLPLTDAFGDPVLDPTGEAISIPIDTPVQVDQVLLNRRFAGSINFRGRRTGAGLTLFAVQRDFELSPDEDVYGFNASASRQLSRVTTLTLSGGWSLTQFEDPVTADRHRWDIGLSMSRQFARDFSGSLSFRHTTQTSDDGIADFDENRVTLLVTKTF